MAASTFSYAQAAKGMSTPTTTSKPVSGAATPAKDAAPVPNGSVTSAPTWADDAEGEAQPEQSTTTRETHSRASSAAPAASVQNLENSSISSPDLGASSASTVTKDDDVSSLPNASSESTWDNKSQASTSVDKSIEPVEKTSEKVKKGKNAVVKPLQEAPLPAVNFWKKRADELKSKTQRPTSSSSPLANGATQGAPVKKNDSEVKGQPVTIFGKAKGQEEDKFSQGRKDTRSEGELKKDSKPRASENAQPPPPKRDQESWPTPDTAIAIDEDRKKAQEKGEKVEKERKESTSNGSHGKQEWVKVPYTPSVVFNTPLPNAANSRRGGRPGGRGGAQQAGRTSAYGSNGARQPEKDGSASPSITNGDNTKRERAEGAAPREASPKAKRAGNAASPSLQASAVEKPSKPMGAPSSDVEFRPRTSASAPDASQAPGQNGAYSRQFPSRSSKPRRGDMAFGGERRRDGDASPTKDNTFDDRRASAATQTDAPGDGERRNTYHDGSNGHQHKSGRFGSYSNGRDRGRGGARGGRGSYANGHQFANGHMPTQSMSSFAMGPRSPTTFNPENPSFFTAPQGKYGRSGHRSQSVTTDPYRFAPYQAGPPVPPLQTYNMYDYGMVQQPMSAVPYTPYVDQFALFQMITTQVEYYFSLDNLLKDLYLRRHMDSQGFVALEFIAAFNRIKSLSTDIELIKLVCQQSAAVQYRTGEDGQDRLRRREGWEQFVLKMADRDASAQNDGPKELHHPPIPHPSGFDQSSAPQWPMSAGEPMGPHAGNVSFPQMNGYTNGDSQDNQSATDNLPNGAVSDGTPDGAVSNGHPVEASTKAVSFQPNSYSDALVARLMVLVRKPDQLRDDALLPSTSRTSSNDTSIVKPN
ncbi:hypothetical protein EK21DRAFT_67678 [Setomelanomma holmii]|uniref:HTH La-type RNA-binding domain-containing protein n=1 Tax=Setomelanomma holmii TaxID=210430 RepID=A0A9P4LL43_9PLEO|nr:hypothetical protein EK21DRAFT_67678 [Setomelanomma holmii]